MRKADRKTGGSRQNIIIKKEEVVEGEGHGGAWKVAYADFVTAMMAFFLLMWLLNATTEDQRKGLADYFSPNNLLSHASSGTGQPFGGHTAFDQGALVSDRGAVQVVAGTRPTPLDPSDAEAQPNAPIKSGADDDQDLGASPDAAPPPAPAPITTAPSPPVPVSAVPPAGTALSRLALPATTATGQPRQPTEAELRAAQERREKAEFTQAAQQIRDAVGSDPALASLARQLAIDITPEGLRIQILDEDGRPMFPLGSAVANDRAMLLLQKVTPVLARLTQQISIAGYTDAAPFPGPGRTNWELSTERANATRRLLVEGGLPDSRIRSVTGNSDRDPLLPANPLAAANRRIAIVVLRTVRPAEATPEAGGAGGGAGGGATGGAAGGAAGGAGGDAGGGSIDSAAGGATGRAAATPATPAAPAR